MAARAQLLPDDGTTISVFASLNAQHENLGDLVLRRQMIRIFDGVDCELNLYAGQATDEFVGAALDGRPAVIHDTAFGWHRALVVGAIRGRSVLVFAPGPQLLVDRPRTIGHEVVNLSTVLWLRAFGRPTVRLGRSLRGSGRASVLMERWMSQLCGLYTVRDQESAAALGRHLAVEPDLAFALENEVTASQRRPWVSFSPRVGRRWPADLFARLIREAEELGLRACFVSQTRFDDGYHADLAAQFDLDHVAWGDRTHERQLERVLARYGESALVVSDRLHGLIFAMMRGATPVPHLIADDKLIPPLRVVGWPADAPDSAGSVKDWLEWRRRTDSRDAVNDARAILDESQRRVLAMIAGQAE